ncbi:Anti-repressor SinI [Paenibacillus sp. 1_12]|uniref:anti-repressor SinI family protein n=1 Tax=Paenibacillus sp. 1_12 TaxID=1566278 RepID=UPI0008EFF1D1|nr:anti-repressor SinI family protein [Paenibacillus sp. 1_12]SFL11104.1 Anti-repressor SinI [Paenibacillus sp. 1_12]
MSSTNRMELELLDVEWVDLIMSARKMGLNPCDIRTFLTSSEQSAQHLDMNTEYDPYVLK